MVLYLSVCHRHFAKLNGPRNLFNQLTTNTLQSNDRTNILYHNIIYDNVTVGASSELKL